MAYNVKGDVLIVRREGDTQVDEFIARLTNDPQVRVKGNLTVIGIPLETPTDQIAGIISAARNHNAGA